MTPIEIITTTLAGVALFVALLARVDSRKSAAAAEKSAAAAQKANDLMARQLELVTSEQARQAQKELMENRPHFAWHGGMVGGFHADYSFINQGGMISKATVTNDSDLQSEILPRDVIATGQKGTVKFSWKPPQQPKAFNFTVEFNDKLSMRQKMDFAVSRHSWGDLKLPELV